MLDIAFIRENADLVQKNAENRGMQVDISALLKADEELRKQKQVTEDLRAQRNANAAALKESKGADPSLIQKGKELKKEIASAEEALTAANEAYTTLMYQVPNMTHPDSPIGATDEDNVEIARNGEPTKFDFEPKNHLELGEQHDLIDFEAGATVAGSGFYFTKNEAVLLDMALTQFAVQKAVEAGFTPMITPDVAKKSIMEGTGFSPRGESTQVYSIENTDLALIATAENTTAGYYANHTFKAGELDAPKKVVALSHCFRTEAGAYGRESKGMYRVHQFSKVELFVWCKPEDSEQLHQELLALEQEIASALGIPFRTVDNCTGDLGAPAYRKYDLEAWMPFRNDWGEITSTSNCTDYQARRLNTRYTTEDGAKEYVHTLNGTAVVLSRFPLAILENFQQEDGSIAIPDVLHPYMMGVTHIGRS